jgi:hypothetical protein
MSIEELVAFISPPDAPVDGVGDWSIPERKLGTALPSDFKELICRYGTGSFYRDLDVANPLMPWGREKIQVDLERCHGVQEYCEKMILHPNKPGLLPWGTDANGHFYCWWTEGVPDNWPIVQLFHGYENEIDVVPGPITSFLVKFMSNEYPNMLGGNEFTTKDHFFDHFNPYARWAK